MRILQYRIENHHAYMVELLVNPPLIIQKVEANSLKEVIKITRQVYNECKRSGSYIEGMRFYRR